VRAGDPQCRFAFHGAMLSRRARHDGAIISLPPMVAKEKREASTSAFMLWSYGLQFLNASRKLGTNHLPALYLACHGIELGLKSHLRANGYSLHQLILIRHSVSEALSHAQRAGMRKPPARVSAVLEFVEEVHRDHEYRYPHALVQGIEARYLILGGGWALRAAAPAVSRTPGAVPLTVMRSKSAGLMDWAKSQAPSRSNRQALAKMRQLLASWNAGDEENATTPA
jgi:hypothetical protein